MRGVNSDVAYSFIRERILKGLFAPGQSLTASLLADEIGISRTPVRDALRQLEADGLVEIRPHFGASVKSMDFQQFCEMCEIRLALESHAAGLAARHRSEAELHEIGAALEAMRGLTIQSFHDAKEQDLKSDLVREDIRFHLTILAAAKNESMKKEILRLNLINRIVAAKGAAVPALADKIEDAANKNEVLAEHDAIFQAITRGDHNGARDAMDRHIQEIIDKQVRLAARARSLRPAESLNEEELTYRA